MKYAIEVWCDDCENEDPQGCFDGGIETLEETFATRDEAEAFAEAIHGYIRRENRVWYANLIDAGLESGILRPDMNWDGVASLCRLKNDGAVVTSYSVTGSFPSMPAGWRQKLGDEDAREHAWYDQSHDKQWNTALGTLAPALEWSPRTWPLPFGNGLDFAIINTAVAEMSPGYGLQRRYEKPVYPFPNPAHDYEARKEADRQESADE